MKKLEQTFVKADEHPIMWVNLNCSCAFNTSGANASVWKKNNLIQHNVNY